MDEIIDGLLAAPDTQLDACTKPLIEKWGRPPKAIEILEVLDQCIYGSLASGFIIRLLQILYDKACAAEGVTHEAVAALALWRQEYRV